MNNKKHILLILAAFLTSFPVFAQFGLKAGLNSARENISLEHITSDFNSQNLTGFQLGFVYQAMPKKSGLGVEIGALVSQKGSTFQIDSIDAGDVSDKGYRELNYLEVPFNLRYRLSAGFIGIYAFGGIYGGYAFSGNTISEKQNTITPEIFQGFMDHLDYGYNFGMGVELFKKIQLGATWSQGLKSTAFTAGTLPQLANTTNKVVSLNIVCLF